MTPAKSCLIWYTGDIPLELFNIKKKPSSDTKYDPMGIFKAKLAGDDEVGRVEGCEEKGEGDGEVKDGMVIFGEEEGREEDQELFNVEKMKVSVYLTLI